MFAGHEAGSMQNLFSGPFLPFEKGLFLKIDDKSAR
jgi:hypothetical protein